MALGEGVRESTLERFKEGRAPDGRRWKTSIRAATTGGKTLIDSSQLRNSIQVTADASGFAVGTNAKHAATHMMGGGDLTDWALEMEAKRKKVKNYDIQVVTAWGRLVKLDGSTQITNLAGLGSLCGLQIHHH